MSIESKKKRSARRHKMKTHDGMTSSDKFIKILDKGLVPKIKNETS